MAKLGTDDLYSGGDSETIIGDRPAKRGRRDDAVGGEHRGGDLAPTVEREGLTVLPYFALAKGFLAGKYRSKEDIGDSPRAARASSYLDERGERVLPALDEIAASRGVSVAVVRTTNYRIQRTKRVLTCG